MRTFKVARTNDEQKCDIYAKQTHFFRKTLRQKPTNELQFAHYLDNIEFNQSASVVDGKS